MEFEHRSQKGKFVRKLEESGRIPEQKVSATCESERVFYKKDCVLCTLRAVNTSSEDQHIFIDVKLGELSLTKVLSAPPGRSKKQIIFKEPALDSFYGSSVQYEIKVTDEFARILIIHSGDILFAEHKDCDTRVKADVSIIKRFTVSDDFVNVADVNVTSLASADEDCTVTAYVNGVVVSSELLKATSSGTKQDIIVNPISFCGSKRYSIRVKVERSGKELIDRTEEVDVIDKRIKDMSAVLKYVPSVNLDFRPMEFIDVHNTDDKGRVKIGSLDVKSLESSKITLKVTVSGKGTVDIQNICVKPGISSYDLSLDSKCLYDTECYDLLVRVRTECGDTLIQDLGYTVPTRSIYDMDNSKKNTRVAEFTNPYDKSVEEFCTGKDCPLQKALKGNSVTGMSSEYNIVPQVKAVYDALWDYGIIYNSDTGTPRSSESYFQRVRTPGLVLSKKQGNCLDLSILMSSLYERIGLQPFVVRTERHAFIGIDITEFEKDSDKMKAITGAEISRFPWNSKNITAIMLETTCVGDKYATFKYANDTGVDNMKKALNSKDIRDICFIKRKRQEGINPIRM